MAQINGDYFKEHLEEVNNYLGKRVTVSTDNSKHYKGVIKTIDPISGSIVLIQFTDENQDKASNVKIITGHSIQNIEIADNQTELKNFDFKLSKDESMSEEQIRERKCKLIHWFEANRITVKEEDNGDLVLASRVTLKSPYGETNCVSSNEIVIRRIQELMRKMPV